MDHRSYPRDQGRPLILGWADMLHSRARRTDIYSALSHVRYASPRRTIEYMGLSHARLWCCSRATISTHYSHLQDAHIPYITAYMMAGGIQGCSQRVQFRIAPRTRYRLCRTLGMTHIFVELRPCDAPSVISGIVVILRTCPPHASYEIRDI
jgi:hypothetical protein